jgi:hypothetical protein
MLGFCAYHRETNSSLYAIFIAGLFLSGWGARLAFVRIKMPATLTFDSSSLTLFYAGSSSTWLWSEIETAWVVRTTRPHPYAVIEFKPTYPSRIVPCSVSLRYPFDVNAEFIRDEIMERSHASGTNDSSEQRD